MDIDLSQFPIRCYTCGKIIGRHARRYFNTIQQRQQSEQHGQKNIAENLLDELHIMRYCCRMLFMTYVPVPTGYVPSPSINPSIVPPLPNTDIIIGSRSGQTLTTRPSIRESITDRMEANRPAVRESITDRMEANRPTREQQQAVQRQIEFSSQNYIVPIGPRTYLAR